MATPISLDEGPAAITTVTAIPAVAPTDPALAGNVFTAAGGNAIEILGHCDANSGKLYLLRNLNGDTKWFVVDNDKQDLKALQVDAALPAGALAGQFSGIWMAGDATRGTGGTYVVLQVGTATFDDLWAASRRL
jgi:hypothetical protein